MDQRDNVQKKLPKLLDKVSEVLRTSNVYRFWSDFDRILIEMKNLFECRGIVVFLTQNGETKMVSSCGGFSLYDHDISGDKLVTSTIEAYGVPHNLCIKEAMENPACPACWKAIDIYPDIDPDIATVLFEKSKLGKRVLHFILFFDSTFHCTEIHQIYRKKEILSQVIHETINIFSSLEKIQGLKDSLKEREKILKEKEQFLKDIAHQFRQPLQGISSYCENLLSPIFSEERKKRIPSYLIDRVRHL